MAASSLQNQTERAHGKVLLQVRGMYVGGGGMEVYKVSFPCILKLVDCPVEGCPAKEKRPGMLREHFIFRHWESKVAILQEGPEPLLWYDQCGIHMQTARLFKHRQSAKCHKLTERRLLQRDVEMEARCGEMEFNLYGEEGDEIVDNVPTFRYLGRPLYQTDYYCPAVQRNIMRARPVWGRLGGLIRREGADTKALGIFYRAVVQAIILYGSETWILLA